MALAGDHGGCHICQVTAEEPCPLRHHHRLTLPSALLDRIGIKDAVITADACTLSAAAPPTWLGGAHYC